MKKVFDSRFRVAGTHYHQNEAKKVAENISKGRYYRGMSSKEIKDYLVSARPFTRVYKYPYTDIKNITLKREPTNKHDKNAIKVLIDNIFIGYIPADISKKINQYLRNKRYNIEAVATLTGGPYKIFNFDRVLSGDIEINFELSLLITENQKVSVTDLTRELLKATKGKPNLIANTNLVILGIMFFVGVIFFLVSIEFLLKFKLLEFVIGIFFAGILCSPLFLHLKNNKRR